jgi:hypothetical protein
MSCRTGPLRAGRSLRDLQLRRVGVPLVGGSIRVGFSYEKALVLRAIIKRWPHAFPKPSLPPSLAAQL